MFDLRKGRKRIGEKRRLSPSAHFEVAAMQRKYSSTRRISDDDLWKKMKCEGLILQKESC